MGLTVENKEVVVKGRFARVARLRHESCDFLENPEAAVAALSREPAPADVFTFFPEIYAPGWKLPYRQGVATAAVLKVNSFDEWWNKLNFKVRNKIRKAEKSGVTLKPAKLDDEFARGVAAIYNESPVRQGKKFWHYGKSAAAIQHELMDFIDRCDLVGAYYEGEMIGFLKLFHGLDVLRTIHIISKLSQRDKPVMDAFIAWSVKRCEEKKVGHLQYGSWSTRSLGEFKEKHGFARVDTPRYFAPLTKRGELALEFNLHRLRDHAPQEWVDAATRVRGWWNGLKYSGAR